MKPVRVLTLAGSLRSGSYNRRLLDAAAELAPAGLSLHRYDGLAGVPMFSEDLEAAPPAAVRDLSHAIHASDALLIATPEYNQSIPGVLKNAIDWLSRPACDGVLQGKVVGILGVTVGQWGTRLAQAALRQVLFATESLVAPGTLFLRDAARLFDAHGTLQDRAAREALRRYLGEFAVGLQRDRPTATREPLALTQPAGARPDCSSGDHR
jgi:chromate reductase